MQESSPGKRVTIKRLPDRAAYDRETVYQILDAGLVGHVSFLDNGQPYVIPTLYVRLDDYLYLHGSPASRMLRIVQQGGPVCIAVTLIDGLVLARSAFHHSMNYRSVVIFGTGSVVEDPDRKAAVLQQLSEHVIPGRWEDVRQPSEQELRRTLVVSILIEEASAKIRTGPPKDDEADYELPLWAGVVPLRLAAGVPVADPRLLPGLEPPPYASDYRGPRPAPEG
jgi:uncharacterized protein